MSFASFLSSPTVQIRIPAPPHAEAGEEKFYTVHRSLLKSNTNIISTGSIKSRDTLCTLPSTTSPAAFEALLEHLYTGNYTLQEEYEFVSDAVDNSSSPVLQAAMKGAIGVWNKPAAVHDDGARRNLSSYESNIVPTIRSSYAAVAAGTASATPAVAPATPTNQFATHEPVLTKKTQKIVKRSSPETRLASHLEVYDLARRYAVKNLTSVSLENIKNEVVSTPEILHELVRVVYGTKQKNEELRAFVVAIVKDHWESLRHEKVFALLLKEGGEFVLDVFSNVKGF
ncbi:hypothetical protein BZA77DRAFT_354185 [Pyronema omphalodes]|nr:hypothetical protein BZA77DRAFT_354185 [Pyronema omphalodes]